MNPDREEARRLVDVLRTLARMLAFSNREIERRLELNHGSVSRVFSGHIEAKLELVLAVSRALGLEYDEFFAFAYPERRPVAAESAAARKLRALLQDLRPPGLVAAPLPPPAVPAPPVAAPAEPVDRDKMLEDLKTAVREIFQEAGGKGGGGPRTGNGGGAT